jgi:hypothetical protein
VCKSKRRIDECPNNKNVRMQATLQTDPEETIKNKNSPLQEVDFNHWKIYSFGLLYVEDQL